MMNEVISRRGENLKTYDLGKGKYRAVVGGGIAHYKDTVGDWQEVNNAIVSNVMSKDVYTFKLLQQTFDAGQIVEFAVGSDYVRFQPMPLQWTNNLDQIQEISKPQKITGAVTNTPVPSPLENYEQGTVRWGNAYGTGRHFEWTTTTGRLMKLLTLDNSIPAPPQYIIDGGNPVLRLSFIFAPSSGLDVVIDGEVWDRQTKKSTFGAIQFRKNGVILWSFNPAVYWDSTEERQSGLTFLRRVGKDLWVDVHVPYSWLQGALYPVFIDPTLTVQPSSKDTDIRSGEATVNRGAQTLLVVAQTTSTYSGIVEFAVDWGVDIPSGATVNKAETELYVSYTAGTGTYTVARLLRLDWVELQATWNIYKTDNNWTTAGAGHDGDDYTSTDAVGITIDSTGWKKWDITNQVKTAQTNDVDVAFRLTTGGAIIFIHSKEYETDTTLRPKLTIEYTEAPFTSPIPCFRR